MRRPAPDAGGTVTASEAIERVRAIARRAAASHGLDLFDVQLRREPVGWVLRILVDRAAPSEPDSVARQERRGGPERPPGAAAAGGPYMDRAATPYEDSVSIQDCERVSRDIGAILDVEDVIDRAYTLEVSSPGLDRPLRDAADFHRFAGRLAKIVVAEPVDGQKHFAGRLQGLEAEDVVLTSETGRIYRIPLRAIARARLEVEF